MNKINYDKVLCEILSKLTHKPTLLLHSCCAPCSTAVIDRLLPHFDITIFYYNPNLDTSIEYEKRKNEQIRYIEQLNTLGNHIEIIENGFCQPDFLEIVKGLENQPEGGKRCYACYQLRLSKTCEIASKLGFKYFCSTLSVSPYKNAEWLNEIGNTLSNDITSWLPSDFKKQEGYKKSRAMARELNMYEQNYCGCQFSKRD